MKLRNHEIFERQKNFRQPCGCSKPNPLISRPERNKDYQENCAAKPPIILPIYSVETFAFPSAQPKDSAMPFHQISEVSSKYFLFCHFKGGKLFAKSTDHFEPYAKRNVTWIGKPDEIEIVLWELRICKGNNQNRKSGPQLPDSSKGGVNWSHFPTKMRL